MKTLRAPLKLKLVSSGQVPDRITTTAINPWDTDLLTITADDDLLAYVTGGLDLESEKRVQDRLNVDLRYRAALDAVSQRLRGSVNFPSLISAVARAGDDDVQPFSGFVVDWCRSRVRLRNQSPPTQVAQGTIGSSSEWFEAGEQLVYSGNGLVVSARCLGESSKYLQIQVFSTKTTTGFADVLIEGHDGRTRYVQATQFKWFEVHDYEEPRVIYVFLDGCKYQINVIDLAADNGSNFLSYPHKTIGS